MAIRSEIGRRPILENPTPVRISLEYDYLRLLIQIDHGFNDISTTRDSIYHESTTLMEKLSGGAMTNPSRCRDTSSPLGEVFIFKQGRQGAKLHDRLNPPMRANSPEYRIQTYDRPSCYPGGPSRAMITSSPHTRVNSADSRIEDCRSCPDEPGNYQMSLITTK